MAKPDKPEPPTVYLVAEYCDCGEEGCHGYSNVSVYATEQTAKQAADTLYGARYLGARKAATRIYSG